MEQIGQVFGFEIEKGDASGSFKVGQGFVHLANGRSTFYSGTFTISHWPSSNVCLCFIDAGLVDELRGSEPRPTRVLLATQYHVFADSGPKPARGVYEGGTVIINNDTKIPGTAGKRAEANSLLTLGLMARVFADTGKPKFGVAGNENVNQIALHLEDVAKKLELGSGFSEATLRQRLTGALAALKERTG